MSQIFLQHRMQSYLQLQVSLVVQENPCHPKESRKIQLRI